MDNLSTHILDEIEASIGETGAILIYGAPFSSHLNPIEYYFAYYKSYLKKNDRRMVSGWFEVHVEALKYVDRDKGIRYFRKPKVPGAYLILTSDKFNHVHFNN